MWVVSYLKGGGRAWFPLWEENLHEISRTGKLSARKGWLHKLLRDNYEEKLFQKIITENYFRKLSPKIIQKSLCMRKMLHYIFVGVCCANMREYWTSVCVSKYNVYKSLIVISLYSSYSIVMVGTIAIELI